MNVNYNNTVPKNQSCFAEIKNTKITFVEPKINLAVLSLIIYDKLPQFYDINTLLKFRLINKAFYLNSIDRIAAHFCEKKFFDNYEAYSIETYNKFIKSKLAKVSPILMDSIEEYIQKFSKKDDFKKEFSRFLFYKMHHLGEILPKTFATTDKILLNTIPINNEARNLIRYFDLSPCGNYCITADDTKTITLFEVANNFNLKKLDVFKFTNLMLRSIKSINFTSENNLAIAFALLNDTDKLVLYNIVSNETTNNYKLNKVAELILTRSVFAKAIMRCNDTKLILLTEKP